ncbi:MAG TPA: hypothetical protein VKB43_13940, partial [Gaiellaceae bacterium]|nr:hypothetical protein [Gaiellaceae bacterium]
MRRLSVGTLLVVVVAAGCGGSSDKTSGEAAKSGAKVVEDALKAANAASAVHMSGQFVIPNGSRHHIAGVDVVLVHGKGATGTYSLDGAKADVILTGGTAYQRAGSAFWKNAGIPVQLAGQWIKFPAQNAEFGSVARMTSDNDLFNQLTSEPRKPVNLGATTYKGQDVIAVISRDPVQNVTLYVAASGTPYPVAIKNNKSPADTFTFDRWNQPVAVTAPKGAV